MPAPQVLIAGAGPTGLVLALWLARLGVSVRLIDKTAEPGTTSRAVAVQARTLEFYRQLGLADDVVGRGRVLTAANIWVRGRKVAHAPFGEMGRGLSPFPYGLIFPQDEHERMLIECLAELGVAVERRTELAGFDDHGGRIVARLKHADGREERCETAYLAGCDGAHSAVRQGLNIGFPGGTYAHMFYVADIVGRGPAMDGELHLSLDEADFLAVFPLKGADHARLIGTVRENAVARGTALGWQDVDRDVLRRLRMDVERVNWFSTYHVHHRVAERFRRGRAFLLGDAGHIHSPVGGQGMNTGIGDAVNLAWKLAAVVQGRATPRLLDTYEPERLAFARQLVATTDRVFTFVNQNGPIARRVRVNLVPLLTGLSFRFAAVRRLMFRTASQTRINYRDSALSEGSAGPVRGGDRLPWVPPPSGGGPDNFSPLAALDWQVHVYGDASSGLRAACRRHGLPLHAYPWREAMANVGMQRDAAYMVRPDGYVALVQADPASAAARLDAYVQSWSLRPRDGAPPASD